MSIRALASLTRMRRTILRLEQLEDRTVPTLLGQQLFPTDHAWNQRIADAPVAANSNAIIANIIGQSGDGRLHPDFGEDYRNGNDLYGIPFNIVHGNSVTPVNVVIDAYPDESDLIATPIPSTVVLEGDYQNGPRFGVDNRGDSHLLIWDVDNNVAYELYRASRPSENADGKWHADQQSVWDMKTNAFRTLGDTSADAAGLSILAGLLRPDEALPVSEGGQGVVNHAIRFTLRNSIILNQFLYPASHTANAGNNNAAIQPPMGARFRLKAGVDISNLQPQSRIIAQAMKDYGMIVADNGSNFFFQGASSSVNASNQLTLTWNDDDIQSSSSGLKSLHFSDFEIVDLQPRVTGLDVHQGNAGTQVTIIGQNFNGAAGNLKVLFGSTVVSAVTYVDDSHLRVVAPPGTGTVDVRVQSGVATNHPRNNTGTVFGYGVSATSSNDLFTYGSEPPPPPANTAPTVATPARATPSPVTGKTTTLSVLGADDGGQANLKYTWSVISKPAGAATPTFSRNATNAARNTVATFKKAGAYSFRVTLADVPGLTAVSNVTVVVSQTLTALKITPTAVIVKVNAWQQFAAYAVDQFGVNLAAQPTLTWKLYGLGILTNTGAYRAPGRAGGPFYVTANYGSLMAVATVTVRA